MGVDTIRPTSCPGLAQLKESWAILRSGDRCYLGRLTNEDGPHGLVRVDDPFELVEQRTVVDTPQGAMLRMQRKCFPLHSLPIDSCALRVDEVVLFAKFSDVMLKVMREVLREAWDARDHMREVAAGSSITIAKVAP